MTVAAFAVVPKSLRANAASVAPGTVVETVDVETVDVVCEVMLAVEVAQTSVVVFFFFDDRVAAGDVPIVIQKKMVKPTFNQFPPPDEILPGIRRRTVMLIPTPGSP